MKSEYERLKKRLSYKPLLDKIATADNLYKQSKFNEAIDVYNEVLSKLDKSYEFDICETYRKIGNCYYALKNHDEARFAYEKTLKYSTTNGSIYAILAFLYYYVDNDVAINYYSKALAINPKDTVALSSKSLTILKSHKYNQKLIKEVFERDVRIFKEVYMKGETPFTHTHRDLKNKKKLHIGYLSSDFYCHAMMQFILPLLESHHQDKFDFTLYSTPKRVDYVTERIKETGIEYKDCGNMTNKQLAQTIYDDEVDILVDLGGFTHSRSFALFWKPAPIQMQYLGFVNTLGMPEVDYIFADEFTIPPKMAKYYTEKPLYLGTCMQRFCFNTKNQELPPLNELPYHKNGYITFGSFNCTSKINDYTIQLWAKLLKAVEKSKLLIYRTQMTPNIIERMKEKFAHQGIGIDRLIFNNIPCQGSHFYAYQLADIALDPVPFNGLTITMEAMSMGVPVLTLAGDSMQSRGCARVNKALNLNDLIAETEEQYIKKGIRIANDIGLLDSYRKNLRSILDQSMLKKDLDGFASHVEDAYMNAWQDYCKSL